MCGCGRYEATECKKCGSCADCFACIAFDKHKCVERVNVSLTGAYSDADLDDLRDQLDKLMMEKMILSMNNEQLMNKMIKYEKQIVQLLEEIKTLKTSNNSSNATIESAETSESDDLPRDNNVALPFLGDQNIVDLPVDNDLAIASEEPSNQYDKASEAIQKCQNIINDIKQSKAAVVLKKKARSTLPRRKAVPKG